MTPLSLRRSSGANSYVLKTAEPEEIVAAVLAVHQGQSARDPAILDTVMSQFTGAPPPGTIETLTAREIEALRLAAQCFTNKAIGVQMGMQERAQLVAALLSVTSQPGSATEIGLLWLPTEWRVARDSTTRPCTGHALL